MSQIFISFKESESPLAGEIAHGLRAHGYTTWSYVDNPKPGLYLEQVGEAIDGCRAVVLLISPASVGSPQLRVEVVRAHENGKKFVPVLVGMTYQEFQRRQPEWRQALEGYVALPLPSEGGSALVNKIIEGLQSWGIHPEATPAPLPTGFFETGRSAAAPHSAPALRLVVLFYKPLAQPDEQLLGLLETELTAKGHQVFIDRHMKVDTGLLLELERQIRSADAVIPLLSRASVSSEMLAWEVQTADEAAQQGSGKPYLLPVRVDFEDPLPEPLHSTLESLPYVLWRGPQDNQAVVNELVRVLRNPPPKRVARIEPAGGAVPLDSQFYIQRPTDTEFAQALDRHDGIVLLKGARQMGKSSLLARGLQRAEEAGDRVVYTDLQTLNSADFTSVERFYPALAELMVDQLQIDYSRDQAWKPWRAPNVNFQAFVRDELLAKSPTPLVWGMDEVDRLFTCDFSGDVFALFRSWFNARPNDRKRLWERLTMVIVYATEAYLFIKDINQSPFNVGTKLELHDFNLEQVAELNRRYGMPLKTAEEVNRFYNLVGGSPYLVRRGLQELKNSGEPLDKFEAEAGRDDGPFGDHLRRILVTLAKNPPLADAVRHVLLGQSRLPLEDFVRLASAGVMAGTSERVAPRSQLYAGFLRRHLV